MKLRDLLITVQKSIKVKENQFNNITDNNLIDLLVLDINYLKEKENLIYKIIKDQEEIAI